MFILNYQLFSGLVHFDLNTIVHVLNLILVKQSLETQVGCIDLVASICSLNPLARGPLVFIFLFMIRITNTIMRPNG